MRKIRVAVPHIARSIAYRLDEDDAVWVFASRWFWADKAIKPDATIEANIPDRSLDATRARELFWEYVAPVCMSDSPTDIVNDLLTASKRAAADRKRDEAGAFEIF
jgi:hypothetical protein